MILTVFFFLLPSLTYVQGFNFFTSNIIDNKIIRGKRARLKKALITEAPTNKICSLSNITNALNSNQLRLNNINDLLDYFLYKQNKVGVDEFINNIEFKDANSWYVYNYLNLLYEL